MESEFEAMLAKLRTLVGEPGANLTEAIPSPDYISRAIIVQRQKLAVLERLLGISVMVHNGEPVSGLGFSVRTRNTLRNVYGDDLTVGGLAAIPLRDLLKARNLGELGVKEIKEKLAEFGLKLR